MQLSLIKDIIKETITNPFEKTDIILVDGNKFILTPKTDLEGESLSNINLSKCDLTGANLRNIDFSNSNLQNARLSGANLSGANLSGANLSGANLSGANLEKSNLRGADLKGTILKKSNLSGADLSDIDLSRADLSGVDLSKTVIESFENLLARKRQEDFLASSFVGQVTRKNWHTPGIGRTCHTPGIGWVSHISRGAVRKGHTPEVIGIKEHGHRVARREIHGLPGDTIKVEDSDIIKSSENLLGNNVSRGPHTRGMSRGPRTRE